MRAKKIEVWFARELQSVLGYARWENFTIAIGRAVESCKSQNINVDDHFREVTKMVALGSPQHQFRGQTQQSNGSNANG